MYDNVFLDITKIRPIDDSFYIMSAFLGGAGVTQSV